MAEEKTRLKRLKNYFSQNTDKYIMLGLIGATVTLGPIFLLPAIASARDKSLGPVNEKQTREKALKKVASDLAIVKDSSRSPLKRGVAATKIFCCTSAIALGLASGYLPINETTRKKLVLCCAATMAAIELVLD